MLKQSGLSLNGGGANGLISAHLIQEFESLTNKRTYDFFNCIAGTSTGALQTALIVCGYSGYDIVQIFKKEVPKIFDKELLRYGIFRSKYNNTYLREAINYYTDGVKLGEIPKSILIPAYNATKNKHKIFKSVDERDAEFYLSDVVLASASAPTYFNAHKIGEDLYEDGGLGYNNPSDLVLKQLQSEIEGCNYSNVNFNIMSLTTGSRIEYDKVKKGIIGRAKQTFENVLREQDLKTHNNMLFDYKHNVKGVYVRIEPTKENSSLKIDDGSKKNIENMIKDGEISAKKNRNKIIEFFNNTIQNV